MLELQLKVLSLWQSAGQALRQRLDCATTVAK